MVLHDDQQAAIEQQWKVMDAIRKNKKREKSMRGSAKHRQDTCEINKKNKRETREQNSKSSGGGNEKKLITEKRHESSGDSSIASVDAMHVK